MKKSPIYFDVKTSNIYFQILWPSHNFLTLRYKFCYRGTFTVNTARSQSTDHWQCRMWGNVSGCWIHWEHTSYIYLCWLQKGWKGFLRGKMHKLFFIFIKNVHRALSRKKTKACMRNQLILKRLHPRFRLVLNFKVEH